MYFTKPAWKGYLNAMIAICTQINNLLAETFHRENWVLEHAKLKARVEVLEKNKRNFMGEDLDSLSLKELQSLEHQLDAAIKSIRSRKNQAMFESISALQKRDKALQDHNNTLLKKIKEREKKTGHQEGQLNHCSNNSSIVQPQYCLTSSRDGFVGRVGAENGVLVVLSQNIINGSVPVGESLTALDPSKSPVHALGFRKIQPNGGFNLSIWFYKTPNTTIVWHAQDVNRTSGLVPAGSKVTLTASRFVRMTDAGNFRLLSKDSSKDLWSSFDNPTDTLLPLRIQAYGIVYKGVLKVVGDSQVTVAVKKLDRVVQEGEKEFRNEVKAIGQTYHKNLKAVDLEDNVILINWAYDCFRNRRLGDLMEDDLGVAQVHDPPNPSPYSIFSCEEYLPCGQVSQTISTRFYVNKKDTALSKDLSPSRSTINHKRQWSNNIGWSLAWSEPDNICAKRFGPYVDSNELRNLACGFNTICIYQRPKCEWAERFL
ncbi:hypothetical protein HID58_049734 [Brassica napus]|uniref:K-box domain-containing protein n=1 Tax=Brassica napus TaxID=3708 RepID=A0ABQ8B5U2_BRANA|nr:hypothetical protein HID58_049734 [Brassica napus]